MPSLINRVPPGLLSLLGIKALGQNPSVLLDEISAELDVTPLYLQAFAELVANTTTAFSAPGIAGGLPVVPPGEMWILNHGAAYTGANIPAATTIRMKACIYETFQQRVLLAGDSSTGTAGDRVLVSLNGPIVLIPGEMFALYCESFTGTALAMTMAMSVTKLTV